MDTAGYALWTLEMGGWKPDATTAAVAEYLLLYNKDLDHWRGSSNRPPSEASCVHRQLSGRRACKPSARPSRRSGSTSALASPRLAGEDAGKDTEDRVFRLWALKRVGSGEGGASGGAGVDQDPARTAAGRRLDKLKSDAYATGTALVALHQAAGWRRATRSTSGA